ncbi:hypothetical protein HK096_007136, partial [Nowakowskiella sp. JEL0078]
MASETTRGDSDPNTPESSGDAQRRDLGEFSMNSGPRHQRQRAPPPPKFLRAFSQLLIRQAKPRLFVGSVVFFLFAVSLLIHLETLLSSNVSQDFSSALPDYRKTFNADELHLVFSGFGPQGRFWYFVILGAEFAFIPAYSIMLSAFVSSAAWKFDEDDDWSRMINLLPFYVALLDILENIALGICISQFNTVPSISWRRVAGFAGTMTSWKWSSARFCGYLSIVTMLWNYGPVIYTESKEILFNISGKGPKIIPSLKPGQKLPEGMMPTRLAGGSGK